MVVSVISNNINIVYAGMAREIDKRGLIQSSRNGETKELHPAVMGFDMSKGYMLSVHGRVINFPMVLAELLWIMNGDRSYWITEYNEQLKDYADDVGDDQDPIFNAAYGHRLRSLFGIDQLHNLIGHFLRAKDTRHAVSVYSHPLYDAYNRDTKDRACNIASMFLIRDDKLDLTQTVRSHDFIWGVPYNAIQFGYLSQVIAEALNVKLGTYCEMNNSLHVYDTHYKDLNGIIYSSVFGLHKNHSGYDIPKIFESTPNLDMIDQVHKLALAIENKIRNKTDSIPNLIGDINQLGKLTPFWRDGLLILLAYHFRKDGLYAVFSILANVESSLFIAMMLRYLVRYYKSWKRVDDDDSLVTKHIMNLLPEHKLIFPWLRKAI